MHSSAVSTLQLLEYPMLTCPRTAPPQVPLQVLTENAIAQYYYDTAKARRNRAARCHLTALQLADSCMCTVLACWLVHLRCLPATTSLPTNHSLQAQGQLPADAPDQLAWDISTSMYPHPTTDSINIGEPTCQGASCRPWQASICSRATPGCHSRVAPFTHAPAPLPVCSGQGDWRLCVCGQPLRLCPGGEF